MSEGFPAHSTYLELPDALWRRQHPNPVADPAMIVWNDALAAEYGIPRLDDAVWGGNRVIPGTTPFAQAYAGHQFGHFAILGDGRALVLGEGVTPSGRRFDLQLKGSGTTPYSRRGDGRAVLGPMLREYVISESLHALGIPTTRSLAVVSTGEAVIREGPLPGAILARVAASHLRVGTVELAAHHADPEPLRALVDYAIRRHAPECAGMERPSLAFLNVCIDRQAALVAQWLSVGFVHGVMNTDNMALSGETIDYGPCAFLDAYDPAAVFSFIDRRGRYAFGNQPRIAHWNLAVLASALLPLIDSNTGVAEKMATEILETFPGKFQQAWRERLAAKLGIPDPTPGDDPLLEGFLEILHREKCDFTRTFLELETGIPVILSAWGKQWSSRLDSLEAARERMRTVNPMVIPRNHVVEQALSDAESGDFAPFRSLLDEVGDPFNRTRDRGTLAHPPPPGTPPTVTHCGT